jgi:hypothetical protein
MEIPNYSAIDVTRDADCHAVALLMHEAARKPDAALGGR